MTPPNWTIIYALPMHKCRIHFHSCNGFKKRNCKRKTLIGLWSLYLKLMDLCDSKWIWGTMIPSIGIWGLGCYTIVTTYPFFNWQLRATAPIPIIWAFKYFLVVPLSIMGKFLHNSKSHIQNGSLTDHLPCPTHKHETGTVKGANYW